MAKCWLHGCVGENEKLKDDFRLLGINADGYHEDVIEIDEDLADVVQLFLLCGTQWRVSEMSGRFLGLIYTEVAQIAKWVGIDIDGEILSDLQVMEHAVIKEQSKQKNG